MRANRPILSILATLILLPTISRADGASLEASEDALGTTNVAPEPWIQAALPSSIRGRLFDAFSAAVDRLNENAACQQLFEHLGTDGTEVLAKTFYFRTTAREEKRYCRGTSAFTSVGGRVTRVCRSFGRLPESRAAVVLIHEALHQAGMSEKPLDPRALDSAQINDLVSDSCAL